MKPAKIATHVSVTLPKTPATAMAPATPSVPERTEEDKMQSGHYDLDHLVKAEEIKQDPAKMEYVKKAHAKKMTAMRSIQDLKDASNALAAKKKKDTQKAQPDDENCSKDEESAAEAGGDGPSVNKAPAVAFAAKAKAAKAARGE